MSMILAVQPLMATVIGRGQPRCLARG